MKTNGILKSLWVSFTNNFILETSMTLGVLSGITKFFFGPTTRQYIVLGEMSFWAFIVALFTICWMFARGASRKCMRKHQDESG